MDCKKIGSLIYELRKDKNMTQKQIADLMNISDKTISKWERGLGCPDISLLPELSQILGVSIDQILSGQINLNDLVGGNMNKLKFYVCHERYHRPHWNMGCHDPFRVRESILVDPHDRHLHRWDDKHFLFHRQDGC